MSREDFKKKFGREECGPREGNPLKSKSRASGTIEAAQPEISRRNFFISHK
jgi:hypothetical protein